MVLIVMATSEQLCNNAEVDVYKECFKHYKKCKDITGILDVSSTRALDKYNVQRMKN